MRLATPIVVLALLAALAGCGSSDGITSSDSATFSDAAMVQSGWEHSRDCSHPAGASRWACSVSGYRCQGVVTDRGWSVSCSRPGRSVAFTVRP
ncbi:MAG: hypothetical protein ACJ76B_09450 [Solirubrobacterales bacterium]